MCLAVPGRIERIETGAEESALERVALVDFGGARRSVSLAFVPGAQVGDQVLVHAGIAIQVVDPSAAEATRAWLDALPSAEDPDR